MANPGSKTKDKVVIKEIDSNIDLLKIFHYSHTRSGSFFLDSALQNQKTEKVGKQKIDRSLKYMLGVAKLVSLAVLVLSAKCMNGGLPLLPTS